MNIEGFRNQLQFMGLAASFTGWIIIFVAISRNPWFIFTKHAFSDLGGPQATNSWIFNYGMMITGLLAICYSFYLIQISINKSMTVGSSFLFIAGVFLMLIGIFPSGTKHHNFVSIWFFTQADLSIFAWGIGLLCSTQKRYGEILLLLSILGPVIAILFPWPSIATVEAYGILIMNMWTLIVKRVSVLNSK